MITLKNNTERVVVLYNDSFRREIPIDGTVSFEESELGTDKTVSVRYFTENNSDGGWNIDVERKFTGAKRVRFFYKRKIHLVSTFDLSDNLEYTLERNSDTLPTIVLLLNRMAVEKIGLAADGRTVRPRVLAPSSEECRRKLRVMMLAELLILLPITVILFIATLQMFFDESEVGVKIIGALVTLLAVFICFDDLYYYRIAKKREKKNS